MKKCKMSFCFLIVSLLLIVIGNTECQKSSVPKDSTVIGKWISTDLVDTVEFTSDHDLSKLINGVSDRYNYSLSGDSILITYNGAAVPFIYIGPPRMRFYKLDGNVLTIDFRSAYYGFRNQIILFHRR